MEIQHFNTIIIGGGPAGVTCGYILTKNKKECLIIDKAEFPREKLCGGGLTPKAHKLVESIFGDIAYDYHKVHNIEVYSKNKFLSSYRLYTEIRNVTRKDFDYVLYNKYREIGGQFENNILNEIVEKDGKVYLTFRDGKVFSCNHLIGADGANSVVRRYLQPKRSKGFLFLEKPISEHLAKDIEVSFTKEYDKGYAYLFPNNSGAVLGCGYRDTKVDVFRSYLDIKGGDSENGIKGAYIPMFDKIDYPFKDNIILIGDAGGYADSISGEGLFYAFKTAQNAALAIIEKKSFAVVNRDMVRKIHKTTKYSNLFFNKFINRIFMYIFKKDVQHQIIEKLLNRYVGF